MNFEVIVLMVIRALGLLGKTQIEKLLLKVDDAVCKSDNEIDNEIYLNIVLPAIQAHQSVCPPKP